MHPFRFKPVIGVDFVVSLKFALLSFRRLPRDRKTAFPIAAELEFQKTARHSHPECNDMGRYSCSRKDSLEKELPPSPPTLIGAVGPGK